MKLIAGSILLVGAMTAFALSHLVVRLGCPPIAWLILSLGCVVFLLFGIPIFIFGLFDDHVTVRFLNREESRSKPPKSPEFEGTGQWISDPIPSESNMSDTDNENFHFNLDSGAKPRRRVH